MIRAILIAVTVVTTATAFGCPANICTRIFCAFPKCTEGTLVPRGGYCGCCPTCVPNLKEGDSCGETFLLGSVTGRCPKGTVCDKATIKCTAVSKRSVGKCIAHNGASLLGAQQFRCNPEGSFAPVQCQGSVCYCVDDQGIQIQGFAANIGQSANMNCRCAGDKNKYSITGLIGKQFNCMDNGNYSAYKCEGSVCFCTDENGLMKGTQSVNIGQLASLNCA